jgi:hypothetical protein
VGNQTFFTKSKILEKAVSQAQNDVFVPRRWVMALFGFSNIIKKPKACKISKEFCMLFSIFGKISYFSFSFF